MRVEALFSNRLKDKSKNYMYNNKLTREMVVEHDWMKKSVDYYYYKWMKIKNVEATYGGKGLCGENGP